jgi:hypothetical protein
MCHDAPWAAHLGRDKTTSLISNMYYWPNISQHVADHIRSCLQCQRNKPSNRKPAGLMVPTQIPERRWSSISVDLITHLPRTLRGHDAIIVFVDRLSKRVHYVSTVTKVSAMDFALIFVNTIFANHGLPMEIISDRDPRFTSTFWEHVTAMLGIQRCMSTAFHPRSDGQTERANRTLEESLRSYVSGDQADWDVHLPLVEFAVNSSYHAAIGTTPFLMEYGQTPLPPNAIALQKANPAARKFVGNWEKYVKLAKEKIRIAQERAKSYFDRRVQAVSFAVGDEVLLSTKNLKLKGHKLGERTKKLMPRFIGPYRIIERIGLVAYKLKLPDLVQIHPVFHVSLLKAYKKTGGYQPPLPMVDIIGGEVHFEIEALIADRMLGKNQQFRARWKNEDAGGDTWEFEEDLIEDAPDSAPRLIKQYWDRKNIRKGKKPKHS